MKHLTGFRPALGLFLGLMLTAAAPAALAGGLRVTPLRLDLSPTQTSNQVELVNFGEAPMPVQVSVARWTQVDGRDVYEPTKDVFFAPPIVSVPAGGKAVVRLRLRGKAPAEGERAYRVYFQEMAPPESQGTGMSFRLRFGVPLFVTPKKVPLPKLEMTRSLIPGKLELALANTGQAHLKIHGIDLFPKAVNRDEPSGNPVGRATQSETGTNYLLAGTRQKWVVPLPPDTDPAGLALLLRADDYSGRSTPGMSNKGWLWQDLVAPVEPGR